MTIFSMYVSGVGGWIAPLKKVNVDLAEGGIMHEKKSVMCAKT